MDKTLPHHSVDIHPWMPTQMHNSKAQGEGESAWLSPLGRACISAYISIHDRDKVYAEMQRVQKEINFKTA